jgi:hypothetical protein
MNEFSRHFSEHLSDEEKVYRFFHYDAESPYR